MRLINLTKGYQAKVDDEDYFKLFLKRWCYCNGYAIRREGSRLDNYVVYMHKEVLGINPREKVKVDHENLDTLDNQKNNLRITSTSKNSQNRVRQSNNTSGYKGVSHCQGKWQAYIKHLGKKIHLGTFATPLEAARAYDVVAKRYFGEFARLNFPESLVL